MDVSPRTPRPRLPSEATAARPRRPRNVRVLGAARGSCWWRSASWSSAGSATRTLFFYNVDEAVAKKACARLVPLPPAGHGRPGSVSRSDRRRRLHDHLQRRRAQRPPRGRPAPAVPAEHPGGARGALVGRRASPPTACVVKHSEVYVARNPDRVKDYDEGGDAEPGPGRSRHHRSARHRRPGRRRVNSALGQAGIVAGLVSSLMALITVVVALMQKREDRLRLVRQYAWMVLAGARPGGRSPWSGR